MFLCREIDVRQCQIYTKMYKYKIVFKIRRFKQIIFSKYARNKSENDDILEEPEKLMFAPILI